ncbi:hypothetical protein EON65_45970 [archaeon]|nr:MAG: hypothetical protein EON65_45970 [archaeon]
MRLQSFFDQEDVFTVEIPVVSAQQPKCRSYHYRGHCSTNWAKCRWGAGHRTSGLHQKGVQPDLSNVVTSMFYQGCLSRYAVPLLYMQRMYVCLTA